MRELFQSTWGDHYDGACRPITNTTERVRDIARRKDNGSRSGLSHCAVNPELNLSALNQEDFVFTSVDMRGGP
jgi:hypothetical protein